MTHTETPSPSLVPELELEGEALEKLLDEATAASLELTGNLTQVDLGDDLLAEKTKTQSGFAPASIQKMSETQIEEEIESARILADENLIEEAKRALRRVMLVDPKNLVARERLYAIHEKEIQQIFQSRTLAKTSEKVTDTDLLIQQLDRDLGLNLELESPQTFFSDLNETRGFIARLEPELQAAGYSAQDYMDLGIAFLEMGVTEVAVHQFRIAARDNGLAISAHALIAQAYLDAQKPVDAIVSLQYGLRDSEVPEANKLELFYLMGRAYEAMGRRDQARPWYEQVNHLEPYYRDIQDRLQ